MVRHDYGLRVRKGLAMNDYPKVSVLNAITGEIYERDLTPEEIATFPEPGEPTNIPEPE